MITPAGPSTAAGASQCINGAVNYANKGAGAVVPGRPEQGTNRSDQRNVAGVSRV